MFKGSFVQKVPVVDIKLNKYSSIILFHNSNLKVGFFMAYLTVIFRLILISGDLVGLKV